MKKLSIKKLSFFLSLIYIFATHETSARCINITTPNGATLYIDNSITVAELFRECRNQGFCEYAQRLVLYFDNYEIIENSQASNKALCYFGNHVEYAHIGYYNRPNNIAYPYDHQARFISVRAQNGMITTVKADRTPAYFFRICRNAGHCLSTDPMILKFGIYEIKENTLVANRPFYEFNTDATYAYVMYWDYSSGLNNLESLSAIGATICGIGFLYFMSQFIKQ
ncbi:hypothetical protein HYV10_00275 [Candidatus Dependentiae bacterium]|nr:hypothetical protein [Candidatus Dependentiae bacterium]